MKGLDLYYKEIDKYTSTGVFRKVYSADDIDVYSILEQSYIVFPLDFVKEQKSQVTGIFVNSEGLKYIVSEEHGAHKFYMKLSDDEKKRFLMSLDDKYLSKLISLKGKYDRQGPDLRFVDYNLESALKKKEK